MAVKRIRTWSVSRCVLSAPLLTFPADTLGNGNRPSDEEVTITRMLDKVLRRSDAVDKESLCILLDTGR